MDLSNLSPAEGSVHSNNFRRGRGHGSGNGKTAGKGHKGQKARTGAPRIGFEGGQMPLYRRLPKRGFKCRNSQVVETLCLGDLDRFEDGSVVTAKMLKDAGIVTLKYDGVKVLAGGNLTKKLTVQLPAFSNKEKPVEKKAQPFSKGAKARIEELGGKAEVI